jgi:hypothetical protein
MLGDLVLKSKSSRCLANPGVEMEQIIEEYFFCTNLK